MQSARKRYQQPLPAPSEDGTRTQSLNGDWEFARYAKPEDVPPLFWEQRSGETVGAQIACPGIAAPGPSPRARCLARSAGR